MKETPDKTQKKKQSTPKRPAGPRKPVPPGKRPPQGARPPRGGSSPGQKPGGETGFDWKKAPKTPLIWIFIIVAVIFLANMFASNTIGEREITYTQFNEYLESGQVLEGEIIGNKFHGVLKSPQTVTVNGTRFEFTRFTLIIPFVDSPMLEKCDTYRLNYTFKEQNTNWTEVLIGIIPWILIIGLWIFWMRRLQGNGNGRSSPGPSRHR